MKEIKLFYNYNLLPSNFLLGGMEDYNYIHSNCMEITIELSCCKYPKATQLKTEWFNNKEALLAYMEEVWN